MFTRFKQTRTRNFSRLSILAIAMLALLLTGCISVQTNVALHGNGSWNGVQAITLSPDFVELMESEGEDLSSDTEGLDEWLQEAQSAGGNANVNASFNEVKGEDGSLSYVLQADGSEYDALNQVLFQGEADISVADVNGQRQVTIRYDAASATEGGGETTAAEEEMSAEMLELFGFSIITRISGGEIINHNADRVEGGTAIWETPKLIEVTLTEAISFDPATVAPQEAPSTGTAPSLATLLTELEENAETDATEETASATRTEELTIETPAEESASEPEAAPDAEVASETQNLPQSGAILPVDTSDAPLLIAGLVLIALVGAGVSTTLRKK
jgi:hypothetical protein